MVISNALAFDAFGILAFTASDLSLSISTLSASAVGPIDFLLPVVIVTKFNHLLGVIGVTGVDIETSVDIVVGVVMAVPVDGVEIVEIVDGVDGVDGVDVVAGVPNADGPDPKGAL